MFMYMNAAARRLGVWKVLSVACNLNGCPESGIQRAANVDTLRDMQTCTIQATGNGNFSASPASASWIGLQVTSAVH